MISKSGKLLFYEGVGFIFVIVAIDTILFILSENEQFSWLRMRYLWQIAALLWLNIDFCSGLICDRLHTSTGSPSWQKDIKL